MSLESDVKRLDGKIETLSKKRDGYIQQAAEVETDIDTLEQEKVQLVHAALVQMGVKVNILPPREMGPIRRCSVCVSRGLSGVGHTAARHYLLQIRGEIPAPADPTTTGEIREYEQENEKIEDEVSRG